MTNPQLIHAAEVAAAATQRGLQAWGDSLERSLDIAIEVSDRKAERIAELERQLAEVTAERDALREGRCATAK